MGHRAGRLRPAAFAALLALVPAAREASGQSAIVLANTRGLEFGRFAAGSGGAVSIAPAGGARSASGGVLLLTSSTAGQASFSVTKSAGAASQAVSITLPADHEVTLSGPGGQMAVNSFVAAPAAIALVPDGGMTLSVGATLVVPNRQPGGSYAGAFNITVNYE
jgi:hypothetical protein